MNIEVFNETNEDLKVILDELKEYLIKLAIEDNNTNIIYNVIIVDNKKIREINKEYRGKDSETDVISFALEDDNTYNTKDFRLLGDIYISLEKAKEQSINYGHALKRELFFLATHGYLHLLGYDHMSFEDEKIMFKKQEEALIKHGITR